MPGILGPQHLGFELAPLVGKLTTNPLSVKEQIEELLLPEGPFLGGTDKTLISQMFMFISSKIIYS